MDYPKSVPNVGLVGGKFVDENVTTGQVGSLIPSVWGNNVTDELLAVIQAGELEPDEADHSQLLQAIQAITQKAIPAAPGEATEEVAGVVKLISDALLTGGVDDVRAVTIKKLVAKLRGQGFTAFTTDGAAPSFTLSPVPAIPAYTEDLRYRVKFNADSSGDDTLNVSGLGAKSIKQYDAKGIKVAAVFAKNQLSDVEYDGTDFVMLDQLPAKTDLINTVRIDVASTAALNLTSAAPSTRNINITGSNAITSFIVSVGQVYFVRFDGSLTLTNNASIITQSGGNIITQAGDSCIIRATAANVVEVLCYSRGIPQALGDGQAWKDLTSTRSTGTTYTNTTGRPIFVVINTPSNTAIAATVGGVTIYASYTPSSGQPRGSLGFIVPPGITYSSSATSGFSWLELR